MAANPPPDRGRLTIFLGYAAGVGKTYAMLETARQRQAAGIDVVVGYAETHGRSEVAALLAGLEQVPLRQFAMRGLLLAEMDIDAILARRPQLVLVDELAHTNAPGSRHTYRHQDVMELLNAGCDVYTTISIQHLESLNDVVAQITGITVRDTVPDQILDQTDEIELIDLPIDELLDRFATGKVYVPEQAQRTMQQLFRPGNLAALREIALRRAADRIDEQMRAYMQAHDIAGPWPASERILVCVSSSPLSERLVRTARRLAQRLNAEWFAVYVETPGHKNLPQTDQNRVTHTLQLAEALGAQAVRLNGRSIPETLVNFALDRNVTRLVVGKPLRPRWQELLQGGSLIDQIVRLSQNLDVYVISGAAAGDLRHRSRQPAAVPSVPWRAFLHSIGLVLAATLVGLPLRPYIDPTNLVMPYLVAVILAAVGLGRYPAIVASLLGLITFDIFFVPPYYTFVVTDAEYLLTFAGLLAVGLVISTLTAHAREQELAARRRETQTAALYELSQKLATATEFADVAHMAVNHVQNVIGGSVALFLPAGGSTPVKLVAQTAAYQLAPDTLAVAAWVQRHGQPAGRHTQTLASHAAYCLPLQTSGRVIGVIAVQLPGEQNSMTSEHRRLLASIGSQVAVALDKASLADKTRQTRLLEETEKLQTALLNSISHDLRTPLASITGVLSSLHDDDTLFSNEARHELVRTAWDEARRLNRLVGNLLDMTRLESGALKVVQLPADVQDLVGSALAQLPNRLQGRTVRVTVTEDLPLVSIDFSLMVQVLVNLLDNALKYAPEAEPIEITARLQDDAVELSLADRGPGLPAAELERIFDKFFRVDRKGISGTGLGLSIAKGIVEAHNGRIWAANRPGGGAVFTLTLPLAHTGSTPVDA